jgi:DNA helicase-2/ATP-dependent DNA helicase PcrA
LLNGVREFADERREAGEADSLAHFLEEVSLLTDHDSDNDEEVERVTLMTIHSAKGLEFPYVYIVGVEEGTFPSPMSGGSPQSLEEERRLFYVAVTRAEQSVTISYAKSRFKNGEHNFVNPSRFLRDIDKKYITTVDTGLFAGQTKDRWTAPKEKPRFDFSKLAEEPKPRFQRTPAPKPRVVGELFDEEQLSGSDRVKLGTLVEHERFGRGEVIALEGQPPNVKAHVSFENAGTKQLLLKFAKLKILN